MIFYLVTTSVYTDDGYKMNGGPIAFKSKENAENFKVRWLKKQDFPQCYLVTIIETSFCDEYDKELFEKEIKVYGVN